MTCFAPSSMLSSASSAEAFAPISRNDRSQWLAIEGINSLESKQILVGAIAELTNIVEATSGNLFTINFVDSVVNFLQGPRIRDNLVASNDILKQTLPTISNWFKLRRMCAKNIFSEAGFFLRFEATDLVNDHDEYL